MNEVLKLKQIDENNWRVYSKWNNKIKYIGELHHTSCIYPRLKVEGRCITCTECNMKFMFMDKLDVHIWNNTDALRSLVKKKEGISSLE